VAQEVEIGSSFTLVCVAEGFLLPSMQWYFNDAKINNSSSRYIVDDSSMNSVTTTLTVRMVEADDYGAYYCEAISGHYDLTAVSSKRVNITVNGESSILKTPFYCAHLLRQLNIVHTHTHRVENAGHVPYHKSIYSTRASTLFREAMAGVTEINYAIFTQVVIVQRVLATKHHRSNSHK